jgi:crotonobetainyl-CoA:carnitine CoA-transferase CaiB-like acyl-CoA transferase
MIVDVEQPGGAPIQIAGVPIKMTETPGGVMRRSPYLGEDTDIQLRKLGLSNEEIQSLIDRRIVVTPTDPREKKS